ncbi:MAG: hypothetical protein WCD81_01350 [Candidatus Bathyarchaeia archaeon]
MQSRSIDLLIDKIKSAVEETGVPPEYDIRIYKNVYACMGGVAGLGVIIEVVGPEEERIKAIDLRAVSKILEFCEKEGCEIGDHALEQHDII